MISLRGFKMLIRMVFLISDSLSKFCLISWQVCLHLIVQQLLVAVLPRLDLNGSYSMMPLRSTLNLKCLRILSKRLRKLRKIKMKKTKVNNLTTSSQSIKGNQVWEFHGQEKVQNWPTMIKLQVLYFTNLSKTRNKPRTN